MFNVLSFPETNSASGRFTHESPADNFRSDRTNVGDSRRGFCFRRLTRHLLDRFLPPQHGIGSPPIERKRFDRRGGPTGAADGITPDEKKIFLERRGRDSIVFLDTLALGRNDLRPDPFEIVRRPLDHHRSTASSLICLKCLILYLIFGTS